MARQAPTKPAQIDDLLTCNQVAEWAGVHPDTVRCWILSGELPAFNVGSDRFPRYRVTRRAVLEKFKVVRGIRLTPRGAVG